ncbi:MAG: hydroxyisourate hydrolase [Halobacteriovoraceae bacterium]|nr:hydroxyisourate hydrolase [Halobacteriovoraceae bacterium]|tara:strand:- start:1151 stop:1474 length:324 start_codon:yes stop_codon:yes gene_type:complete
MISTHILDTSLGHPAEGVKVVLFEKKNGAWLEVSSGVTNEDGRFVFDLTPHKAQFKILFSIKEYFEKSGREVFFLDSEVAFEVKDDSRKYHVPLLLNPYGYSTYRGS